MNAKKPIVSSNPDPGVAEGQDDGLLASLGYKQGLPTSLSWRRARMTGNTQSSNATLRRWKSLVWDSPSWA